MTSAVLPFLAALAQASAPPSAPVIEHEHVGCMVAGRFPRLEARLAPAETVAVARVVFRPEGGAYWYSVRLAAEAGGFAAVLPKPTRKLKRLSYYIEVTDVTAGSTRTEEYGAEVVGSAAACQERKVAAAVGSAAVALEVPVGAAPIPAGFSAAGVTGVGTAGATGASGSGAGSAAGSGLAKALLIGGGAAAAAGAAAVAAGGGGGDGSEGPSSGPTGPSSGPTGPSGSTGPGGGNTPGRSQWNVEFLPWFEMSWCTGETRAPGGPPLPTFGGGVLDADANGNFDTVLPNTTSDVVRLTGRATDSAFNAQMTCVSGRASTTLSASGSGGRFQGSFSLAGATAGYAVSKKQQ